MCFVFLYILLVIVDRFNFIVDFDYDLYQVMVIY